MSAKESANKEGDDLHSAFDTMSNYGDEDIDQDPQLSYTTDQIKTSQNADRLAMPPPQFSYKRLQIGVTLESIIDLVRERAEAQCNNCMAYFEAWEIQEAEHELLAIALGFFGDKGHKASLSELYILEETYIGGVEPQSNKRKKLKENWQKLKKAAAGQMLVPKTNEHLRQLEKEGATWTDVTEHSVLLPKSMQPLFRILNWIPQVDHLEAINPYKIEAMHTLKLVELLNIPKQVAFILAMCATYWLKTIMECMAESSRRVGEGPTEEESSRRI